MGLLELFIIAVGLSMDAFAVAICKGLSVRTLRPGGTRSSRACISAVFRH